MVAQRAVLSDVQWEALVPLLPAPARTGRRRADDRRVLEAILWVLRSGARWQDVPRELAAPTTAWRRLKEWEEAGVWEQIWRTLLSTLDAQGKLEWAQAFLDGSFVPAKRGELPSA
jgi:transposase